ncbi:nucleotidyltransferase domain-containing protein [archaeon]|nr:nucleotidyltransferase domain-containing protein [archaeon]
MNDKFEVTIQKLLRVFPGIKDVLVVYLYGSVARKDYSLRHSDLDLFIVVKSASVSRGLRERIDGLIIPVGLGNGVRIHTEYQGTQVRKQDQTLLRKMVEEGKVMYSSGVFTFSHGQLGLGQFLIYTYSSKEAGEKTMLSKILHGRKSSYGKGPKKVVKEYAGIVDGKSIISLGRGVLMVAKQKQRDIERLFTRLGAGYKLERIVYSA